MLRARLLTSLAGIPAIIILFAYRPRWLLLPLFLGFVGLSAAEMAQLVLPRFSGLLTAASSEHGEAYPPIVWHHWLSISIAVLMFMGSTAGEFHNTRGMVTLGLLLAAVGGYVSGRGVDQGLLRAVGLIFVVAYSVLPWLSVWDLYILGDGSRFIMTLLAIVWCGDAGAYFIGTKFGKHRLAPEVSPKKSIEGAVGGLLFSIIGALAANLFYSAGGRAIGSTQLIIWTGLIVGVSGQIGDLAESVFKRFAGVKDSGNIFPGHGGFLDRVDSLMFAAPVLWFILFSFQ